MKDLLSIGTIKTPYKSISQCPNNVSLDGAVCHLELKKEYITALTGLAVDQSITILYWLGADLESSHQSLATSCRVESSDWSGVFATRSPLRPNPIGVAVLEIDYIHDNKVTVTGLDCLNGTQLLDIKPAIYKELR